MSASGRAWFWRRARWLLARAALFTGGASRFGRRQRRRRHRGRRLGGRCRLEEALLAREAGVALRLQELLEQLLESLDVVETAVDRGEAHVSHLVDLAQALHHQSADLLGGDLAV